MTRKETKDIRKEKVQKTKPTTNHPKVKKVKLKKSEKFGRAKKYRQAQELIEKSKEYSLEEALDLLLKMQLTKFNSSIEAHIRLNIDLTKPEHQIRGLISLPHGTGKIKKIAAITTPDKEKKVKEAGADLVGGTDLIEKIKNGLLDFDILVSSPEIMGEVGKIAKILGPKGLMPNPKSGTVAADIEKVVAEIKKGQIEFRVDKNGIIHQVIGKKSMSKDQLQENFESLIKVINKAKPSSIKENYITSIFLCQTMGPSIKLKI